MVNYGTSYYTPVVGDWNNDGIDTICVEYNGFFYMHNSLTAGQSELIWNLGPTDDIPIVGHWFNNDPASTDPIFAGDYPAIVG